MALVEGTNCGFVPTAPTGGKPGIHAIYIDNRIIGGKFVAPTNVGIVTEIGWYNYGSDAEGDTENANFEAGIYTHDATNNRPLNLLAGVSRTNAKGTSPGWKVANGLNITITGGTTYWIVIQLDDTATGTDLNYDKNVSYKLDRKGSPQTTLPDSWGTTFDSYGFLPAIYAVYETAPSEGFLEITGITAPESAMEGKLVNFIVHTKNIGANDTFKVELSGDLTGYQEFSLGEGLTYNIPFFFRMPNHSVIVDVIAYHLE